MVADVDIRVALSGGVDSSIIFAAANKVQAVKGINVSFDSGNDESFYAKAYANYLKAEVDVIGVEFNDKFGLLNQLLLHFDQPYADSSLIPFYFLSKTAGSQSKVLIGGDGGDEVQNGYLAHKILLY